MNGRSVPEQDPLASSDLVRRHGSFHQKFTIRFVGGDELAGRKNVNHPSLVVGRQFGLVVDGHDVMAKRVLSSLESAICFNFNFSLIYFFGGWRTLPE